MWHAARHGGGTRVALVFWTLLAANLLRVDTAHADLVFAVPQGAILDPWWLLYWVPVLGCVAAVAWTAAADLKSLGRLRRESAVGRTTLGEYAAVSLIADASPQPLRPPPYSRTRKVALFCAIVAMIVTNPLMAAALAITVVLESVVAVFAGWRESESLRTIVLVNLLTNPITNMVTLLAVLIFGIGDFYGNAFGAQAVWTLWVVAEIVVIICEWRLLVWVTSERWGSRRLLILSIVSNMASAVPGSILAVGPGLVVASAFSFEWFMELAASVGSCLGRLF